MVWNNEPVRDVFLVINGSGILSNAFVHPRFEDLLDARRLAYATYDKPGIKAPFGDPAEVRREDSMLERYTLGHGIACATGALRWAREQFGPSVRLHLRGHSEGALVALYTYDAMLESDAETANSLASIVLSGLALEPFDEILEIIQRTFDVNFYGPFRVTQAFLPLLRNARAGRIVNVSSTMGSLTVLSDPNGVLAPLLGAFPNFAYGASKTALNALTAWLALELAGTPIKVNTLCPGYNATDMNQHTGTLHPSEGAKLVVRAATLGADGPSGSFFDATGAVAW